MKTFNFHSTPEQKVIKKKALDASVGMDNADVIRTFIGTIRQNEDVSLELARKIVLYVLMNEEVVGQVSDGEFEDLRGNQVQHLYNELSEAWDDVEVIEDEWEVEWNAVNHQIEQKYSLEALEESEWNLVDKYSVIYHDVYRRMFDFDDNFVESLLKEIYPSDWKWFVKTFTEYMYVR